jgi:hypothetical protein
MRYPEASLELRGAGSHEVADGAELDGWNALEDGRVHAGDPSGAEESHAESAFR